MEIERETETENDSCSLNWAWIRNALIENHVNVVHAANDFFHCLGPNLFLDPCSDCHSGNICTIQATFMFACCCCQSAIAHATELESTQSIRSHPPSSRLNFWLEDGDEAFASPDALSVEIFGYKLRATIQSDMRR
jgi:hypothetical protein